jgi:hypothetical protein
MSQFMFVIGEALEPRDLIELRIRMIKDLTDEFLVRAAHELIPADDKGSCWYPIDATDRTTLHRSTTSADRRDGLCYNSSRQVT